MQVPERNILQENPRKFMISGVALMASVTLNGEPLVGLLGLGLLIAGFLCWLDEDRYQAVQAQKWRRFDEELERRGPEIHEIRQRMEARRKQNRDNTATPM
jgi:hypothetical protein